ncbi:hypothetical protein DWZ63_15490 [Clostridium sp. AF34-13]|nr:hypothetical protein DWZ63_15490 [Clostridium sp. AF34-13]
MKQKESDTTGTSGSTNDSTNDNTSTKISVGKVTISKAKNIKGRKVEIQYKKVSKAKGYQIRYSLKTNMGSSKTKSTTKTKYTLKSLKKNKKYYIQVRDTAIMLRIKKYMENGVQRNP